jgi:F-type H+-transporting ATPase subunit b
MELDWTTFILQVINFLVLVWLLKRFLYRPVMDVIARRQAAIDQSMADARATEARARQVQADYEARLAELDAAHAGEQARLAAELADERQQRLARLDAELAAERDRRAALASREAAERQREAEAAAHQQAGAFLTRLLGRLGDTHLDQRLLAMLLEDLPALPEDQRHGLRQAAAADGARLSVTSARALDAAARQRLEAALAEHTGQPLSADYRTDPTLLAGLRVSLGPWLLAASLADELAYFRSGARCAD